jgi:hypothetical protein
LGDSGRRDDRTTGADTELDVKFVVLPPGTSLRFAIRTATHRTRFWTVRSVPGEAAVIVSAKGLGEWFHVTLHDNDAHWHYVIDQPGRARIRNSCEPREVGNGLRRAL